MNESTKKALRSRVTTLETEIRALEPAYNEARSKADEAGAALDLKRQELSEINGDLVATETAATSGGKTGASAK